jgi:hypothetical protein
LGVNAGEDEHNQGVLLFVFEDEAVTLQPFQYF